MVCGRAVLKMVSREQVGWCIDMRWTRIRPPRITICKLCQLHFVAGVYYCFKRGRGIAGTDEGWWAGNWTWMGYARWVTMLWRRRYAIFHLCQSKVSTGVVCYNEHYKVTNWDSWEMMESCDWAGCYLNVCWTLLWRPRDAIFKLCQLKMRGASKQHLKEL